MVQVVAISIRRWAVPAAFPHGAAAFAAIAASGAERS